MQYLNTSETAKYLHIGRTTLYRHMKDNPSFPKPVRFGTNTFRWRSDDLDKYITAEETSF